MLAGVSVRAAELQDEFNGPVAYGDRWIWFALLALVLVGVYFLAVVWFTRERTAPSGIVWGGADVPTARRQHLDRIDEIETEVRGGRLPARDGHQQLSETVRSYVGAVSELPATTMTLSDFRVQAPWALTEAIELMYPPEFAPDEVGEARERFDAAVAQARQLVMSWN